MVGRGEPTVLKVSNFCCNADPMHFFFTFYCIICVVHTISSYKEMTLCVSTSLNLDKSWAFKFVSTVNLT